MCLIIKSGPHISERDIFTLKTAEGVNNVHCYSFYRVVHQYYEKLYTAHIKPTYYDEIANGLHSIYCTKTAVEKRLFGFWDMSCERGVVLCKIPKGSTFYLGKRGDIVSNQLILLEPLVSGGILKGSKYEVVKIRDLHQALSHAEKICKSYKIKIGL